MAVGSTAAAAVVVVDPAESSGAWLEELRCQVQGLSLICVRSRLAVALCKDLEEEVRSHFEATVVFETLAEAVAALRPFDVVSVHAGSEQGLELADALAAALPATLGAPAPRGSRGEAAAEAASMAFAETVECSSRPAAPLSDLEDLVTWAASPLQYGERPPCAADDEEGRWGVPCLDLSNSTLLGTGSPQATSERAVAVVVDPAEGAEAWLGTLATTEGMSLVCVHSALFAAVCGSDSAESGKLFSKTFDFRDVPSALGVLEGYDVTSVYVGSEPGEEIAAALASALRVPCKYEALPSSTPTTQAGTSDPGDLQELLDWAVEGDSETNGCWIPVA